MLISHESPLCLLNESRKYNHYDYALVHLFEEIPSYYQFFVDSLKMGRRVILDNSIFELGKSFEPDRFLYWINQLKPSEYIIPDVLEDALGTMDQALDWKENQSSKVPTGLKSIGVVQGKTYSDIVNCYNYLDINIGVDKLAFSFDYSLYQELHPHENKWVSFALGRAQLLSMLIRDRIINTDKPHHLLGCALPIEFMFYRDYKWLESLDTSNPVVHGLLGIGYEPGGLINKKSIKLVELMHLPYPSSSRLATIKHNVEYFRSYVQGFRS